MFGLKAVVVAVVRVGPIPIPTTTTITTSQSDKMTIRKCGKVTRVDIDNEQITA